MGLRPSPTGRHGNRGFNRLRLGVRASLVLTHETRECLIDDISTTGARLRVNKPLAPEQTILLRFHELRSYASVVWCTRDEAGLRFDQPLDLEDMKGMLWITENRDLYDRMCQTRHLEAWSSGTGG